MHTEEQARQLWCPMARAFDTADVGATSTNRPLAYRYGPRVDINCIASACAMWRIEYSPSRRLRMAVDTKATSQPDRPGDVPPSWIFSPYDPEEGDPAGWVEPEDEQKARRQGYCGLAPLPKD